MRISRRAFLAASAGTLSLPRSALAQGAEADVIVIGAGMAGLSAAAEVQRRGKRVIALEAQTRIGGRIWTDRSLGLPVEMGRVGFTDHAATRSQNWHARLSKRRLKPTTISFFWSTPKAKKRQRLRI